jgi:hypothetical protein
LRALAPFVLPLILFVGFGFGATALLYGLRRRLDGWRIGSYLVVPGSIGLVAIGALLIGFFDESVDLVPRMLRGALVAGSWLGMDAAWSVPIGLAAIVVGVLAAELIVVVLPAYVADAWAWLRGRGAHVADGRPGKRAATDVARAVLAAGTVAGLLVSATTMSGLLAAEGGGRLVTEATYDLPGTPTSVVAVDAQTGYIAFAEGSIDSYRLPAPGSDESIVLATVADGLSFPRGLAIADGRLFAIDLGPLQCDPPYPTCYTGNPDEELARLAASSASVLSYPIEDDGSLGEATTILEDIPVVNTEHAPGSIDVGPDGMLYMTVGNIDALSPTPDRLSEIEHPNLDLLGTLIRFRTDGSGVERVLTGIRNIYQLARDDAGNLYGVDNGGVTARNYLGEEVLVLREGLDYGYPRSGTFAPGRDPATFPLTLLTSGGSAGLAWGPDAGLEPGLVVGTSGQVLFIPLERDADGPYVSVEHPIATILDGISGFVPSLTALPDGRLLVTVFGGYAGLRNELMVISRL